MPDWNGEYTLMVIAHVGVADGEDLSTFSQDGPMRSRPMRLHDASLWVSEVIRGMENADRVLVRIFPVGSDAVR